MDLHVYRNSKDRWHDLKTSAVRQGAVLAVNAVTLEELVERLTPDIQVASAGQRLASILKFQDSCISSSKVEIVNRSAIRSPISNLEPELQESCYLRFFSARYAYDAVSELKACRIRSHELRASGAAYLADVLDHYDRSLRDAGLYDPQDRYALAAARVREDRVDWLERFERVVLHTLYDLTEAEFMLVRSLIEKLPDGGTVVLFNTTANVKPTQFAEWTWKRFIENEALAEKTFPEFCRPSNRTRAVLERLFVFEPSEPISPDDSLRIVEAPSRYQEIEKIGADIADLLVAGENPAEVAVVVRHIETYGEMLEDVFNRYRIPFRFETGVPLLRVPFIKYWLAVLDLVSNDRSREALARVMSSAYFRPRLSPAVDVDRTLAEFGYVDRRHLRASALAARKNSPLTAEIERFELVLDDLERSSDTVTGFMSRFPQTAPVTARDRQAWRVFSEEMTAAAAMHERGALLVFGQFRRLASEIAALRTVDRLTASDTAPGLPRVHIVHPHSLGARPYRWIFAPGLCDGEFPARTLTNPLLSDSLVEAINARIHQRCLKSARDRSRREPLYLFMILDSATQRVTLSYPASTLEGEPIYPSVYVGEIARHYAESPVQRSSRGPARSDGEWKSRIAEEWGRGSLEEDRARALLGGDIVERARCESRGIMRARIARGALPLDVVWHPSELNSLSACPFVFLARHRLNIRPPEAPDFEVPALEVGILAHDILRDFHSRPVPASADEARARMQEVIARRLSGADINGQGRYSVFDPSLWKIRRRQLVDVLDRYVDFSVRDARDGFETKTEYLDSPLPAAALGSTMLAGKPDHVAIRTGAAGIDAIRVDDFKYSAASSGTARQLKQSFQIPIYAYLAARAAGAEGGVRIEGRYLLLRSPETPVISHAIDESLFEELRGRIETLLDTVREGHLEPHPADRQGCAECSYRRLCRMYGG